MPYPQRKKNRIAGYDYSTPNAYFITVCTAQKRNVLWRDTEGALSDWGEMAEAGIREISQHYADVTVVHYAVMPNHVHLLLRIGEEGNGAAIPNIVRQFKGMVSRKVGCAIWQKGYYDRVMRGEEDYRKTWEYIEYNPVRWMEDDLFGG